MALIEKQIQDLLNFAKSELSILNNKKMDKSTNKTRIEVLNKLVELLEKAQYIVNTTDKPLI